MLHDHFFELVHLHAMCIDGHAHHLWAIQTKALDGGQKSGAFDQRHIVGVEQSFGNQIERLLAAGGDNQTFGTQPFHTFAGHKRRELFAQRVVAFGGTVLQRSTGLFAQGFGTGLTNALHIKHGAVGKATGKTDDAWFAQ